MVAVACCSALPDPAELVLTLVVDDDIDSAFEEMEALFFFFDFFVVADPVGIDLSIALMFAVDVSLGSADLDIGTSSGGSSSSSEPS